MESQRAGARVIAFQVTSVIEMTIVIILCTSKQIYCYDEYIEHFLQTLCAVS